MARYIDIEKAEYPYMSMSMFGINSKDCRIYNEGVKATEDMIQALPTADVVEVVRCSECKHSINLDKNCALNRNAYKHCQLWRGEELTNIWHRYKKYYKDYSIVELDGFCDSGERRTDNE